MKIREISSDLLVDGKVRIPYKEGGITLSVYCSDGKVLPTNGREIYNVDDDCFVEYELDKVYYEVMRTIFGHKTKFTAFIKSNDNLFIAEIDKSEIRKESAIMGKFNLQEKDRYLNNLKQPNTVILSEDTGRALYENFDKMQVLRDEFNILSEEELIEKANRENEWHPVSEMFSSPDGKNNSGQKIFDVDIIDFKICEMDNYAVHFVSNSIIEYTKITEASMREKGEYIINLESTSVDFSNILNRSSEAKKIEAEAPVL